MQSETVQAAFERTGTVVDYRSTDDYTTWWQATAENWEDLAIKLGIFQPRD